MQKVLPSEKVEADEVYEPAFDTKAKKVKDNGSQSVAYQPVPDFTRSIEKDRRKKIWLNVSLVIITVAALVLLFGYYYTDFREKKPIVVADATKTNDLAAVKPESQQIRTIPEDSKKSPLQEKKTIPDKTVAKPKSLKNIEKKPIVVADATKIYDSTAVKPKLRKPQPAQVESKKMPVKEKITVPEKAVAKPRLRKNIKKKPIIIADATKIDDSITVKPESRKPQSIQVESKELPEKVKTVNLRQSTTESDTIENVPAKISIKSKKTESRVAEKTVQAPETKKVSDKISDTVKNKKAFKKSVAALNMRNLKFALVVTNKTPKLAANKSSEKNKVQKTELPDTWKIVNGTKSGTSVYIDSQTLSYPSEDIARVLIKTASNKNEYLDLLEINCRQTKFRLLEQRLKKNPALTPHSHEWVIISPQSILKLVSNAVCSK
jgi:hypothetical protein